MRRGRCLYRLDRLNRRGSGRIKIRVVISLRIVRFKIDWFDLLAVQGPLRSLLQHRSHIRPFITGLYVYGTSRKGKSVETGRLVLGGG